MKKYVDFTQGNIVRAIILFSIPLIMGELLQNLYNSVDALVVGNLIDQHALAAVTVCGMIANMVINFFNVQILLLQKQAGAETLTAFVRQSAPRSHALWYLGCCSRCSALLLHLGFYSWRAHSPIILRTH